MSIINSRTIGKAPTFTAAQEQELAEIAGRELCIVAFGQSNTLHGAANFPILEESGNENGKLFYFDGVVNRSKPLNSNTIYQADTDAKYIPYAAELARIVSNSLGGKTVNVLLAAAGGTSFSAGHWIGTGEQFLKLKSLLADVIINKNQRVIFGTFTQGESDRDMPSQYFGYLSGIISAVRDLMNIYGQKDAYSVPFITGRIHPTYTASTASTIPIDDILKSVGTSVASTSGITIDNLPAPTSLNDGVHYTAIEQQYVALELYNGYLNALANTLDDQLNAGEYLLMSSTGTADGVIDNIKHIMAGGQVKPNAFVDFQKLFKCRNKNGYKIRVEYDDKATLTTESVTFYQRIHPVFSTSKDAAVKVISATSGYKLPYNLPFTGLYLSDNTQIALTLSQSATGIYQPVGQSFVNATTDIPISAGVSASELRVYAIKE